MGETDILCQQIEKKYDFTFPKEYRQMREQGWMTLKLPVAKNEAQFITPGHNYLLLNEMEWYPLEDILALDFSEYYNHLCVKIAPFAFTGNGDHWCWDIENGMRVLLCPHDSNEAVIYAPDFKTAIFRQALEGASLNQKDYPKLLERESALQARYATDLSLIFSSEWCELLRELSTRLPIPSETVLFNKNYKSLSLLTYKEREKIEKAMLHYPDMDKKITWWTEEAPTESA